MIFGKIDKKSSISDEVVELPKVTRSEPRAQSREIPRLVNTSDGSGFPVLQADPEEQANPSTSSIINRAFPSTPLKTKLA
jgi:hypothetical protein